MGTNTRFGISDQKVFFRLSITCLSTFQNCQLQNFKPSVSRKTGNTVYWEHIVKKITSYSKKGDMRKSTWHGSFSKLATLRINYSKKKQICSRIFNMKFGEKLYDYVKILSMTNNKKVVRPCNLSLGLLASKNCPVM